VPHSAERIIAELLIEHCQRPKFANWGRITAIRK
jgi:hypothetical protein